MTFVHKFYIEYHAGDGWIRGLSYNDIEIAIFSTGARYQEWRIVHEQTGLIAAYQSPSTGFMRAAWARDGRVLSLSYDENGECDPEVERESESVCWLANGF